MAVILPVDVSGKRRERMRVACAARSVIQAQYQDAVRRQIANVGHAFVDLQVAYRAETAIAQSRDEHERLVAAVLRAIPARKSTNPNLSKRGPPNGRPRLTKRMTRLVMPARLWDFLLNVPPQQTESLVPRGRLAGRSAGATAAR